MSESVSDTVSGGVNLGVNDIGYDRMNMKCSVPS